MEILVKRLYKKERYCIGKLYIDGIFICHTLEDTDRGLAQNMPLYEIKNSKIYGQTAIPTGRYEISLNITSPKFSSYTFYKEVCNGKVPRLLDVPGFDGILIHVGDGYKGPDLTYGCILVGDNTIVGGLTNGKERFKQIYGILKSSKDRIFITIE